MATEIDTEVDEARETTIVMFASLLAEHAESPQCDGDYGEMQWLECSCGADWDEPEGSEYRAGYERHVAEVLTDWTTEYAAAVLSGFSGLADWHETKAEKANLYPGSRPDIMAKAAEVHTESARRIRDHVARLS